MSDTPITDKACGWPVGHHGRIDSSDLKLSPDGPFVHSSVARELERENSALRKQLQWTTRRIEILSTTFYGIEDLFKNALTEMFEDSLKVEEKDAQP